MLHYYLYYLVLSVSIDFSVQYILKSFNYLLEKMPSWLSGLIQQKDETPARDFSPPPTPPTKETATDIKKPEKNDTKITEENPSLILPLLRGKETFQTSMLELIQDLAKKKQNIQQATITLIQDQLNSDLLIKVT